MSKPDLTPRELEINQWKRCYRTLPVGSVTGSKNKKAKALLDVAYNCHQF
jgi:hypothetical protein